MLKSSSASGIGGNLGLEVLESPPSSPNRNAAFSLLAPEVGRLDDFRKGDDDDLGGDLEPGLDDSSGSSIHAKLDCAIVDRVGRGTGLASGGFSVLGSRVVVCGSSSEGIMAVGARFNSGSASTVLFLLGVWGGMRSATVVDVDSDKPNGLGVFGRATSVGSAGSIKTFVCCIGLDGMTSELSVGKGIVESSR